MKLLCSQEDEPFAVGWDLNSLGSVSLLLTNLILCIFFLTANVTLYCFYHIFTICKEVSGNDKK